MQTINRLRLLLIGKSRQIVRHGYMLIVYLALLVCFIDTVIAQTHPGATWETRTPAEADLDPDKLAVLADYVGGRGCVIRHGYMIYSWGSQSKRDYVYSAEKPWYAHFLWKALEDGKIPSLDQKVNLWEPRLNDINADLSYKDRNITWRHLANQTSCYGVRDNPGEAFNYNDYQMALFWDTLFLKVYGATYDTVDSAILHPMLTDVLQCQDNPTFIESGHSCKGSLGVSVRDFARFGLLYLRKGNWQGSQLISTEHATMAVTSPLPATLPNSTEELAEVIDGQRTIGRVARVQKQGSHRGSYSWLWWTNGVDYEGNRNWPDAPTDAYMASGGGGNRMAVIPSLDLVVVSLGTPKDRRDKNEALRLLVEAVQSSNPADQKGRDDSGSHGGPAVSRRMVFPGRNWQPATPESQGVDSAKLKVAVAYMDENFGVDGAKQLVIVRNGRLIWEGPDSDAYHETYSATKVFTSTILGLLIDSGKCTLDTMAVEHLPDLADRYPAYAEIRLRHLVSMTGGYRGKLENISLGQKWGDPIAYATTPDAPEFEPTGSQIAYNDHDVHLLGRILATRIAQEPLKDVFQRRIAGPIGMTRWDWGICGTVDGMVHYNAAGTPTLKGNGGIRTTPRELARLGQLYLSRGRWNGKQLLSASFVDEATATQIPVSLPGRSSRLFSGAYGFYWWTNGVMTNGKRRYPAAPPKTYSAQGKNSNFCFVIPEWNMVIVKMGTRPIVSYAQGNMKWDTFFTKLGGALCAPTTPHEATIHPSAITDKPILTGERKAWHTITISFTGPQAGQSDTNPNPFLDYRLQVCFTGPSGQVYNVPGFFDGNGQGRGKGNFWRVRFTPDEAGSWSYNASFRQGKAVAIDLKADAGKVSRYIDGTSGKFDVAARNADADGFLSKGRLVYEEGSYYLKTLGDGKYWIKGGTDSPENFLAYNGFVNTTGRDDKPEWFHDYDRHIADWNNGDPDWDGGKGKGIIGSLNYLSSKHVNSIYVLLMNIGGDGQDVWPWSGPIIRTGGNGVNENKWFDINKLRQWEIVFEHAQRKGINLNFTLNEGEKNNKRELDNARLGTERKLYYREMIARFGHHNALQWMLCEEYDHPDGGGSSVAPDMIKSWAQYIKNMDPYRHPVSVHNMREEAWEPFFGDSRFDLTSFQTHSEGMNGADYSSIVERLRNQAFSAGRKIAICLDETVTTSTEDNEEHIIIDHGSWKRHVFGQSYIRKNVIYPIYFSGGSVELILHNLLATDNFHQYNNVWDYMYYARKFMEENLSFHNMQPHDELLTEEDRHGDVLAKIGTKYAIYLPEAQNTGSLDLTGCFCTFTRRWYNPRIGAFEGTATVINGGDNVSLGPPPGEPTEDWVVLLEANTVARVSIVNDQWHINGTVTYPGAKAEGLLMNVRMVNCTFEDLNRPNFDAEANTEELIARIPDYMAHGVRAFTLNLQGGMPGYEGAVNSAFNADGTLRESYLKRVRRVIEACNRHGAVVILGCYYQRQDQILKDEDAVRTGVINVVKWIKACGFTNVVLEINNEYAHKGFDHQLLKSPEGVAELIRLAKRTAPGLLVSASGYGDGRLAEPVARASDFLLIHFNGTSLAAIPGRIGALKRFGKPIVCNEDDKLGGQAAKAAELSVANGASWGLMLQKLNQHLPFTFNGAADDTIVYEKLKELTSP